MLTLPQTTEGFQPLDVSRIYSLEDTTEATQEKLQLSILDHIKNGPRLERFHWFRKGQENVYIAKGTLAGFVHPDSHKVEVPRSIGDNGFKVINEHLRANIASARASLIRDGVQMCLVDLGFNPFSADDLFYIVREFGNRYPNNSNTYHTQALLYSKLPQFFKRNKGNHEFDMSPVPALALDNLARVITGGDLSGGWEYTVDEYIKKLANHRLLDKGPKHILPAGVWEPIIRYLDTTNSLGHYCDAIWCMSIIMGDSKLSDYSPKLKFPDALPNFPEYR